MYVSFECSNCPPIKRRFQRGLKAKLAIASQLCLNRSHHSVNNLLLSLGIPRTSLLGCPFQPCNLSLHYEQLSMFETSSLWQRTRTRVGWKLKRVHKSPKEAASEEATVGHRQNQMEAKLKSLHACNGCANKICLLFVDWSRESSLSDYSSDGKTAIQLTYSTIHHVGSPSTSSELLLPRLRFFHKQAFPIPMKPLVRCRMEVCFRRVIFHY